MTVAERERAIGELESTAAALVQTIQDFPSGDFSKCPEQGVWSAAHTLEHIVFVEGRVLARIRGVLRHPADPSRKSAVAGKEEELFAGVRSREDRIQAPPAAQPAGTQPLEQLLPAFEAGRQATIQFARETDADLRQYFAPHPVFGELDCYQWLMLIAGHGERHRRQIEECRATLAA